ncbi:hypothetical protein BATDEDRAFT_22437 [Batrachochytrium dendrobatidis JAM81]|uniref:Uncharacterized protein n=1 Tax=Batrachochytrium dendrobatidis (strain JAM81 / FGSC 10211) TaxID=684364 RepID=F4NUH0_BATDJ|nr:uncharacterized protein BATDEDRAFT_22437 [Batrachochytrium dendrobatidis JAM81]EGF83605.1 hypothetical protein BATDEDRAFT_22437 [Batrachochytrium dendrobatidis JAM81]|eukprot:XP_006675568.1 hypothetical protein BATDEDRAFT_22437 [Batrachochytrium dendrobatidis JAM81]
MAEVGASRLTASHIKIPSHKDTFPVRPRSSLKNDDTDLNNSTATIYTKNNTYNSNSHLQSEIQLLCMIKPHPYLANAVNKLLHIIPTSELNIPNLLPHYLQSKIIPFQQLSSKQKLRAFSFAGIAPSAFNLRKVGRDLLDSTAANAPSFSHKLHNICANNEPQLQSIANLSDDNNGDLAELSDPDPFYQTGHEQHSYAFLLRQGFKFQHIIRHRHQFLSVIHHIRVPVHFANGSIGHEAEKDNETKSIKESDIVEDQQRITRIQEDEDDVFRDIPTAPTTFRPSSIATLDRNHCVNIWNLDKDGGSKHRQCVQMEAKFSQIIFIPKYAFYAGVYDQHTVKFFTSKMDITNWVNASHPIYVIHYSARFNELIVAGTHHITIWSLNGVHQKGQIQVEATHRITIKTGLEKNDWIENFYIDEKNKQIWAVIDVHLMLFDYFTGERLEYIENVTSRKISCIINHDAYQYTLVGNIDGTIKVINIVRAVVHEFVSHTKRVTAIAIYPYGPLILSCGLDYCIRMYNLKSFREIFSFRIHELPRGMQLINDSQLFIYTRNTVEIWATNQINLNLATLSSSTTSLVAYKGLNTPTRIVIRTSDGVIRLSSPANGRAITATLPLLETDAVRDISYFPALDRLYVMLNNGEIWTFRTDHNPCTVVDIWRQAETAMEHCTKLVVFEGFGTNANFTQDDITTQQSKSISPCTLLERTGEQSRSLKLLLRCSDQKVALPDRFGFLFGATANGHLIVFGRGGSIINRFQIHLGPIQQIICDSTRSLLFSLGKDEVIRVCRVCPTHESFIQIELTIPTNFNPLLMCVMENTICVASEDATLHMFEFNLDKHEWSIIDGHPKTEDHTDEVISICSLPKSEFFITMGKDASMRLWNKKNILIREIQFQEQPDGLCVANPRGDLLIAIHNRIDIIRHSSYLPPNLVGISKTTHTSDTKAEQPLPFDDGLIPLTRAPQLIRKRRLLRVDKSNPWSVFSQINLFDFDSVENEWADIDLHASYSLKKAQPRYVSDMLNKLGQEYHAKMTNLQERDLEYKDYIDSYLEESNNTNEYETDLVRCVESRAQSPSAKAIQSKNLVKSQIINTNLIKSKSQNIEQVDIAFQQNSEVLADTEKKHKYEITIAPDGSIPNSGIIEQVNSWLTIHGKQPLTTDAVHSYKRETLGLVEPDDDEKRMRSEQYKTRLKDLMMQMKRDESTSEVVSEDEQALDMGDDENDDDDNIINMRIQRRMLAGAAEIVQQTLEIKLSPIIEKMMEYDWFPDDQIFYAAQSGLEYDIHTIITNSKGDRMRKVKVDSTSDALIPILLNIFEKNLGEIRKEILQFISWINQNYGFRDTTLMERHYCRHLQLHAMGSLLSSEILLRTKILDYIVELNPNNPELIPTLLMYTTCMYDALRFKAIQLLRGMGVMCIEEPPLMENLTRIFEQASDTECTLESSASQQNPAGACDVRTMIVEFLRENLKHFLVKSTPSIEMSKKLQALSIYGLEEKKRLEERVVRQKSKKKPPQSPSESPLAIEQVKPTTTIPSGRRSAKRNGLNTTALTGTNARTNSADGKKIKSKTPLSTDATSAIKSSRKQTMTSDKDTALNTSLLKDGFQRKKSAMLFDEQNAKANLATHRKSLKSVNQLNTNTAETPDIYSHSQTTRGLDSSSNKIASPLFASSADVSNKEPALKQVDDTSALVDYKAKAAQLENKVTQMRFRQFPTSLDLMFYPVTPVSKLDITQSHCNPIQTLQDPLTTNFIDAINYVMVLAETKLENEEAAKKELEFRAALEVEHARLEAEARDKLLILKAQKAAEKLARDKARVERIAELKRANKDSDKPVQPRSRMKLSDMRTGGVGHTHQSHCHESRETLDVRMMAFPPIFSDAAKYMHSSLAMHILPHKSMPMERVRLNPFSASERSNEFSDSGQLCSVSRQERKKPTSQGSLRLPSTQTFSHSQHHRVDEDDILFKLTGINEETTISELDYIRGATPCIRTRNTSRSDGSFLQAELLEETQSLMSRTNTDFQGNTSRLAIPSEKKYFIYDLSVTHENHGLDGGLQDSADQSKNESICTHCHH